MALALLAQPPLVPSSSPYLTIDPCVDVDEEAVRDLVELELRGVRVTGSPLPESVTVTCVDGAQEIRVGTSPATEQPTVRTLHLPELPTTAPAAIEARSRELALAIAELIRGPALAPEPPPPAPAPPTIAIASTPPAPEPPPPNRQLGFAAAYERFSEGATLAGADVFGALRVGHLYGELRVGGRRGSDQSFPAERLVTRALDASASVGVSLLPSRSRLAVGLGVRAQTYLVELSTDSADSTPQRPVRLAAVFAALAPQLALAVTPHLLVTADAAVGLPVRGIVIRAPEQQKTASLSGTLLSIALGAAFAF